MSTTYMIACVSGLQVSSALPSEMCCALKHSVLKLHCLVSWCILLEGVRAWQSLQGGNFLIEML